MKMVVHHLERDYPNLREKRRCLRHHIHHKHKILLPRKKQRRLLPRSICVPIRSAIPKCRLATPLPFFEYPHNLNRISFRPPKARFPGGLINFVPIYEVFKPKERSIFVICKTSLGLIL